ncbi:MAG: endonuclease/exonuclease/phosphatase family protein, partial [Myxococcota bacterium]|nr:endonuclease/exonuclease/phosphatase family protein [Myxococcota bacterium]
DELLDDSRFYGPGLAVFAHPGAVHTHHEHYTDCSGLLDGASDCLASKGFQVIRLQLGPGSDHTLDLYNTHMEAGGGEDDVAARSAHLDQLIAAMSSVSADRAVLFLGDTNLHGGDPTEQAEIDRLLDGTGLTELCTAVDCAEPERIDRILYRSSDALQVTGLDWWVDSGFTDPDGVPLSDHDPIVGDIGWSAE